MNPDEVNQQYNAASIDYKTEYTKLTIKVHQLEVNLKEARLKANRLDRLLAQKNRALLEIRKIVQRTFEEKDES
jgi:hypothetical protein